MSLAIRNLILFAALLFAAPGLAQEKSGEKKDAGPYRLQVADEISVEISPQKSFNTAGIILPDGFVFLRKVGKLRAAGRTLEELAADVRKVLEDELKDPEVLVTLTKMAPPPPPPVKEPEKIGRITIVGSVAKTGPIDLEEGLRLRKALDLAGGTTKDADLTQVLIVHRDLTRSIVDLSTAERVSDPAHNRILKDGDSIEVKALPVVEKKTPMVRIRGQVQTPGQYELKPGMTLEDLIIAAGKLSPLADVENVQFQSVGGEVRNVNLVQQQKLGLKGKIFLREGDEIFISEHENRVLVVGAIQNPGPRSLKGGQKLRDFLLESGDATAFNPAQIDLGGAQIIRRGQEPIKVDLRTVLKSPDAKGNVELASGDLVYLPPKKAPKENPLSFLQALSPIGFLFGLF